MQKFCYRFKLLQADIRNYVKDKNPEHIDLFGSPPPIYLAAVRSFISSNNIQHNLFRFAQSPAPAEH